VNSSTQDLATACANDENTDNVKKVVIYGGNGFVGTHVAKALSAKGICTACLSRTGHRPLHLKDEKWSEHVRWCKGNALEPDMNLLKRVTGLVCLVGSAPMPTTSSEAFNAQITANGETNRNAIKAALYSLALVFRFF